MGSAGVGLMDWTSMWTSFPARFRDDLARASRLTGETAGEVDSRPLPAHVGWLPTLSCLALGGSPADAYRSQRIWAALYDASRLVDEVQDDHLHVLETPARTLNAAVALYFQACEAIGGLPPAWQADVFGLLREVVTGQANETFLLRPTLQEALAVADNKTGAFLGLGCRLGALAAHAADPSVKALTDYGRSLGALVQVHDDLEWLEALGEGGSLREAFSNIALASVWDRLSDADRAATEANLQGPTEGLASAAAGEAIRTRLIEAGARVQCAILAAVYRSRARTALEQAECLAGEARNVLVRLVEDKLDVFRST